MKRGWYGARRLYVALDAKCREFLAEIMCDNPSLTIAGLARQIGVNYRQLRSALSEEGMCSLGSHRRITAFVIREQRLRMWSETLNAIIQENPAASSTFRAFLSRIGKGCRDFGNAG